MYQLDFSQVRQYLLSDHVTYKLLSAQMKNYNILIYYGPTSLLKILKK